MTAAATTSTENKTASASAWIHTSFNLISILGPALLLVSCGSPEDNDKRLFKAVQARDLAAATTLIAGGANVNYRDKATESTALDCAAHAGDLPMLSLLLERGANPNQSCPLVYAVLKGNEEASRLLLEKGADVNQQMPDGTKAIFAALMTNPNSAAYEHHVAIARVLLEKGADPNAAHPGTKFTALSHAVLLQDADLVRVLLQKGATNWDSPNMNGETAIDLARRGAAEITTPPKATRIAEQIQALLKEAADPKERPGQEGGGAQSSSDAVLAATGPLFEAVAQGDAEKVKTILDQKADINVKSSTGRTPLIIAAMNGKVEVVKLLLDRGADAQLQDNKGRIARQLAAEFSQDEVVKLLDQARVAADPQAAFFAAVDKGDTQAVRRTLDQGADVNATMGLETTALMVAASKNYYTLLGLLLEKGANVNAVDFEGRSAYERGDTEGQRLLAEKGAATDGSANHLNKRLRTAVSDGDVEKATAALSKKADPNLFGYRQSDSVLMIAARSGNLAMAKLLLKHGANPNRRTSIGNYDEYLGATALFYAAGAGRADIAKALIEAGGKVNARTKGGFTPLLEAAQAGSYDVAKVLLENGADPNAKDSKGQTAMALAAGAKRHEIQDLLVKAGASGRLDPAGPKSEAAKTSAPANAGSTTPAIDSRRMTKADWKQAYYSRFPSGSIVTVTRFKSIFGQPSRTQTVQNEAYWFYNCFDGVIQVVLNDPSLLGSGACVQNVNDY